MYMHEASEKYNIQFQSYMHVTWNEKPICHKKPLKWFCSEGTIS